MARATRSHPALGHVLIIAMSGYGHAEARQRALEAGFDECLTKPVPPAQLAQLISARRITS